jgi:ABC-type nickel/cobalt efflux system permease component RcnA
MPTSSEWVVLPKEMRKELLCICVTHMYATPRTARMMKVRSTSASIAEMRRSLVCSHLIRCSNTVDAVLIIQLSLIWLREHFVRFRDFLKIGGCLLIVRVLVWMPLQKKRQSRNKLVSFLIHSRLATQHAHTTHRHTFTANFRYAFFRSASDAFFDTPKTS